jgi:hypothetical protein
MSPDGPRAERAARRRAANPSEDEEGDQYPREQDAPAPSAENDEGDEEGNPEDLDRSAQQAAQERFDKEQKFEDMVDKAYNGLRAKRTQRAHEFKSEREEKGPERQERRVPRTRDEEPAENSFGDELDFGGELNGSGLGGSRQDSYGARQNAPSFQDANTRRSPTAQQGTFFSPQQGTFFSQEQGSHGQRRMPSQATMQDMSLNNVSTRSSLENMASIVERLYEERAPRHTGTSAKEVRVMFAMRYPNTTIGEVAPYFDSLLQIFVVFNMCARDPVKTLLVLSMITTPHSMPTHDGSPSALTFEQYLRFFTEKQLGTTHDIHNKMSKQLEDPSTRPAKQGATEPSHAYEGRGKSHIAAITATLNACGCSAAAVTQVTSDYMMCWFQGADIDANQMATIVSSYNGKLSAGSTPDTTKYLKKVVNVYEANKLISKTPAKNERLEIAHAHQQRDTRQQRDHRRQGNRQHQRPILAVSVPDVSNDDLLERIDRNTAQLNVIQTGGPPPAARAYPPKACAAHNGRHDVQDCPDKRALCNMHGNAHKRSDCPTRGKTGSCYNCGIDGHFATECRENCRMCDARATQPHKDDCQRNPTNLKRKRDAETRPSYRQHDSDQRRSPLGNGRGRGR